MLSKQTAKKLPRRELEYIAVLGSEELARLEQYIVELEQYAKEVEQDFNDLAKLVGRLPAGQNAG
ncbi:hypothetical protein ACET7V_15760 [Aeromonas sanarellii]|uniref:hypothetical protein n=1 Tax=Aeromonas sanarellii TaxID=633415 RepID=UPI0038CFC194